ncbi:MAG: hypothetical protein ISS70_20075 [Phycisphaerae bacterium]|nr:hypothetical protein [Phycisphaerae bacterium]
MSRFPPCDQFRIDICWWCDAVDLIASSPGRTTTSKQILGELLGSAQSGTKDKTDEQTEPARAEDPGQTSVSHAVGTGPRLADITRTWPARARLAGLTRRTAAAHRKS